MRTEPRQHTEPKARQHIDRKGLPAWKPRCANGREENPSGEADANLLEEKTEDRPRRRNGSR